MSRPRVRPEVALGVMCLSNFVASIDVTIVNVALPTLSRDLRADNAELQWIVDAYSLTAAGFLLTAGNLGDRYGRRGWLIVGLAIFGVTSAVAGSVGSAEALIAARAAMGLGAATIFPTTLALITNVFVDPTQRAKAIGLWSAIAGLGVVVGPIAGGWLLGQFPWGSIFWINVPIAAVAIVGAALFVPTSRDPARPPLDFPGLFLSGIAVTALTYTIIEAPNVGWTGGRTLTGLAGSAVMLATFLWHERRTSHPMLDLSIFADRRFAGGSIAVTTAYLTLCGFVFVMTQYLQFVTAYTPFQTGLRLLPLALSFAVASILAPRFAGRFGTPSVVAGGLAVYAAAIAWSGTFDTSTQYLVIAAAMALLGGGLGFTMAPATDAIMTSLSPATAGVGSAVTGATRQLGGTLGVAIIGSVFASVYTEKLDRSTALFYTTPRAHGSMRQSMAEAERVLGQLPATQAQSVRHAVESAFLDSVWASCLVCTAVAAAAAAAVAVVLPRNVIQAHHSTTQITT
ncbi:Antiseptic resistance protein [Mycobacterium simulans]|uniref:DHA2 family efflux MFS transporter permease subunit n=1 Tax=Mycobacterium simulans TaxID=627089 RepID=UPI00174C7A23|nr:DHA2 family efflux MFS transporter permease subunit [Mycobacterium simulans]SON59929.1 Antiseptic resistance protein [Mycobacterium simulans]